MTTLFTAGSQLTPEAQFIRGGNLVENSCDDRWYNICDKTSGAVLQQQNSNQDMPRKEKAADEAGIPLQLCLSQQIQHLRDEMNSLRVNSSTFKEKMEYILSTLENLNEATLCRKSPWLGPTTPDSHGFDDKIKTPISFSKSSDRRKWVTGIASRISRDDVDHETQGSKSSVASQYTAEEDVPISIPVTMTGVFYAKQRVASVTSPHTTDMSLRNRNQVSTSESASKFGHLKLQDIRPNSDTFVAQARDTIELERTIFQASNLLLNADEKDFSNPSPKSATGEEQVRMLPVLDRTCKYLLTSEDSIDSGYHGGVIHHHLDSGEHSEYRLPSVSENQIREKMHNDIPSQSDTSYFCAENIPQRPNTLAIVTSEMTTVVGSDQNAQDTNYIPEENAEKNMQSTPKVLPRASKRIKMGISSVVGPKPKARTIFNSPTDCSPTTQISEQKNAPRNAADSNMEYRTECDSSEQTTIASNVTPSNRESRKFQRSKNALLGKYPIAEESRKSDSEPETSSALRRRSMRMMAEFKLFDFSDSVKGIDSKVKNSPTKSSPTKPKRATRNEFISENKISLESVVKTVIAKESCINSDSKKQVLRSNSSVKGKKRSETKFQKEPLPPPPLPPPPSPPKAQQQKEISFVGFTSLATHEKQGLICNAGLGTPLSSPKCVRRPVHGSNHSLQSTGTGSYVGSVSTHSVRVTNLTPSEGSAFTPVGMPKNSHDHLPLCQHHSDERTYVGNASSNDPEPLPFNRRSSLPPSAISRRNEYKKNHQSTKSNQERSDSHSGSSSNHRSRDVECTASQVNFKRSASMRITKSGRPLTGQNDLENHPVAFNPEENIGSVVGMLKQAGYLANTKKMPAKVNEQWTKKQNAPISHKTVPNTPSKMDKVQNHKSERRSDVSSQHQPSSRAHRKSEIASTQTTSHIQSSTHQGNLSTKESSKGSITMGLIRASFRSKRGRSNQSATNAGHEFAMSSTRPPIPSSTSSHVTLPMKVQRESSVTENSRNKVKQRLDLKPATPTPSVAKARRRKQAKEKSSKTSMVGMLIDKLQLSRSDSSATSSSRSARDDSHAIDRGRRSLADVSEHPVQVIAASVPTARRIFKLPSREGNLRCGSLTSTSSVTSIASHAPSSPLKGRSTYV